MIGAAICAGICVLALIIAAINGRAADDSLAFPCIIIAGLAFIAAILFAILPGWLAGILIFMLCCKAYETFG